MRIEVHRVVHGREPLIVDRTDTRPIAVKWRERRFADRASHATRLKWVGLPHVRGLGRTPQKPVVPDPPSGDLAFLYPDHS